MSGLSVQVLASDNRVLVTFTEEYDSVVNAHPVADRVLSRWLTQQGLKVLDQAQVTRIKARKETQLVLSGDIDAAVAIDLKSDTEWILKGNVTVSSGPRIMNGQMRPRAAQIGLTLISTETGVVVYSGHYSSRSAHIDVYSGGEKAIRKALKKSYPDILPVLLK
ncbi:MAG: hypothetical protein HOM11_08610 [Methylococcales bacterium]|mgnify:CR=1 FL=1|nr:hypothetical protein [Methylococcales bacterium]MBT7445882.1 hypothetical protein [Methylococcales bacterium]